MNSRNQLIALLVLIVIPNFLLAQKYDDSETDRFGAMVNIDGGVNFNDRVFQGNSDTKISVGPAFITKQRKFIVFVGGGAKFVKFAFRSPDLRAGFVEELNANYVPIASGGFDSLVGESMSKGGSFRGTTGAWLNANFTWNNTFRPSISIYYGVRGFPNYGNGFVNYLDPEYHDHEYGLLTAHYYEVKLGVSPPFLNKRKGPFTASINVGYKLLDFKDFSIERVRMASYTNNNFVKKYRYSSCLTITLSFQFWSNWVWDSKGMIRNE